MAENTIEIIVKAVDQMSAQLKEIQANMAGFSKTAAATGKDVHTLGGEAEGSAKLVQLLESAITGVNAVSFQTSRQLHGLVSIFEALKEGLPLAGLGAAAFAFGEFIKQTTEAGVELRRTSELTGIQVESLSALKVAAEQNDSSLGALSISLRSLNREIAQAVTSGGEAQKALLDLGFTNQQITGFFTDTEGALIAVAKKIAEAGSAAERTRLAIQFFGRAGRELIPLLVEIGEKGLEGVREKAEAAGLIMSGAAAEAAKEFNSSLTSLGQEAEALRNEAFLPLIETLNDFVKNHTTVVKAIGAITAGLIVMTGVLALIEGFKFLSGGLGIGAFLLSLVGTLPGLIALGAGIGVATLALYGFTKAHGDAEKSSEGFIDQLKKEKEALAELERSGQGGSNKANDREAKIKELEEAIAKAQERLHALDEQLAIVSQLPNDTRIAQVRRFEIIQEQLRIRTALGEKTGTDILDESEGKDIRNAITGKIDEAAKAAKSQIDKLKAEAAKAAAETSKLLAQIGIESANRIVQQSGNVRQFLDDIEKNVNQIADASKKSIELEFKQKFVGATPAALAALEEQKAEQLRQADINKSKQLQDQFNKALELTIKLYNDQQASIKDVAKAQQALSDAQLDTAKKTLDFDLARIPVLDEVLKRAQAISDTTAKNITTRNTELIRQRDEIQREITGIVADELNGEQSDTQKTAINKFKAQEAEINAEIEKNNQGLIDRNKILSEMRQKFQEIHDLARIQANITVDETKLDTLKDQLERIKFGISIGADARPFQEILDIDRKIDAIEADILKNEIAKQEIKVAQTRKDKEDLLATQEQLAAEEAALAKLRNQAVLTVNKNVEGDVRGILTTIDQQSSATAKNFADKLMQGLQDHKLDFTSFFQDMGKALITDLIQELLKSGIKKALTEQAIETGEKPADTLGGQFLQQGKFLLGKLGIDFGKPEPQKDPVQEFLAAYEKKNGPVLQQTATAINKAASSVSTTITVPADKMTTAASVLKSAGEKLLEAANTFITGKPSTATEAANATAPATPQDKRIEALVTERVKLEAQAADHQTVLKANPNDRFVQQELEQTNQNITRINNEILAIAREKEEAAKVSAQAGGQKEPIPAAQEKSAEAIKTASTESAEAIKTASSENATTIKTASSESTTAIRTASSASTTAFKTAAETVQTRLYESSSKLSESGIRLTDAGNTLAQAGRELQAAAIKLSLCCGSGAGGEGGNGGGGGGGIIPTFASGAETTQPEKSLDIQVDILPQSTTEKEKPIPIVPPESPIKVVDVSGSQSVEKTPAPVQIDQKTPVPVQIAATASETAQVPPDQGPIVNSVEKAASAVESAAKTTANSTISTAAPEKGLFSDALSVFSAGAPSLALGAAGLASRGTGTPGVLTKVIGGLSSVKGLIEMFQKFQSLNSIKLPEATTSLGLNSEAGDALSTLSGGNNVGGFGGGGSGFLSSIKSWFGQGGDSSSAAPAAGLSENGGGSLSWLQNLFGGGDASGGGLLGMFSTIFGSLARILPSIFSMFSSGASAGIGAAESAGSIIEGGLSAFAAKGGLIPGGGTGSDARYNATIKAIPTVTLSHYREGGGVISHAIRYSEMARAVDAVPALKLASGGEVPAFVTPGEYIMPVSTVNKVGVLSLDALKEGKAKIHHFASGGFVSGDTISQMYHYAMGGYIENRSSGAISGLNNSLPTGTLSKLHEAPGVVGGHMGTQYSPDSQQGQFSVTGGEKKSDDVHQNIYLVDQRRPNLGPNDVELIVTDSIDRGRTISKSVQNVLRRQKR